MKVLWTEGLFMTPQHLQLFERELRRESLSLLRTGGGRRIGLLRIEVDPAALNAGRFALKQLSGLLPDGTWVDAPAADPLPPAIDLPRLVGTAAPSVWLQTPQLHDHQLNLTTDGQSGNQGSGRYTKTNLDVYDVDSGTRSRAVEVGQTRLFLRAGVQTQEPGIVSLKIAEVTPTNSGAWQLGSFVPESLVWSASDLFRPILENALGMLSTKRRELAERRRGRQEGELTSIGQQILVYLTVLNGAIARLDHVLQQPSLPPERVFDVLVEVTGAVGTFTQACAPPPLPTFDPEDLARCFGLLLAVLREELQVQVQRDCEQIPLRPQGKGRWTGSLGPANTPAGSGLYLVLDGLLPAGTSPQSLAGVTKLTSPRELDQIIALALPAVSLIPLSPAPSFLPPGRAAYFQVRTRGTEWEVVRNASELSLYLPAELGTLDVALYYRP